MGPLQQPLQIGLLMTQAQFSLADASRFDAFRTAMFLRAMHYDVVLGLNPEVLDGLDVRPIADIRQGLELALTPAESARLDGGRDVPVAA